MPPLRDQSELFAKLSEMYEQKTEKEISENFFRECVEIASTFDDIEIRYALFKINMLNEDIHTGNAVSNDILNTLQKLIDILTGKNIKKAFIKAVLEATLANK